MKIKQSKGDRIFDIINIILLIAVTLVILYPLYFIVIASFSDPLEVLAGKVVLYPKNFSLDAYGMVFKDSSIMTGYRNTIFYTVFGTALNITLSVLAAYPLSRRDFIGRQFLTMVLTVTMFFSGGMIPTYLVMNSLSLTNTRLILILMGMFTCYNMIIARTFFANSLPKELLEAASIDGCGNTRFFFTIALPLSKAIVAVIALYIGVMYWNNYFTALIYVTKREYFPLQLILREILVLGQQLAQGGEGADVDAILEMQKISESIKYGVILVSMLPVMLVYPFVQKYFVQGVMIGSVKG